jgi:hypothetical protein
LVHIAGGIGIADALIFIIKDKIIGRRRVGLNWGRAFLLVTA